MKSEKPTLICVVGEILHARQLPALNWPGWPDQAKSELSPLTLPQTMPGCLGKLAAVFSILVFLLIVTAVTNICVIGKLNVHPQPLAVRTKL